MRYKGNNNLSTVMIKLLQVINNFNSYVLIKLNAKKR